jgi:hypothetical protein
MTRSNKAEELDGWASAKLRRPFVAWLKIEAARRGVFMGDLLETLVEQSIGRAPWRRRRRPQTER